MCKIIIIMKKILGFLVLLVLSTGLVRAAEYVSTTNLAVVGDKAFLLEGESGSQTLVAYSFPGLVEQARLALDSNFSYANAYDSGVVVYNYTYDVPVASSDDSEEKFAGPIYFKETYEIKTYGLDLVASASKSVENQYYYGFVTEPVLDAASGLAEEAINKCEESAKGKKKKKGSCDKVPARNQL